jgi:hypothetical protein
MVHVARLEKRDENIDIEQRPHGLDILIEPLLYHLGSHNLLGRRE